MTPEVSILIVILTGTFTLLGALGSQLVSIRGNLRAKKLELAYARKAEAYRDFVIKAGTFGHDPWDEEKYVQFLHTYLAALLVASEKVEITLRGDNGVHINAQLLRTTREYIPMSVIQSGSWLDAMNRATEAMRDDLQSLSKC
jgi:hypothetical protein